MVKIKGEIGVEMEVLIVVFVVVLILYDMVKVLEKFILIELICLLSKSGGKFGDYILNEKLKVIIKVID